MTMTRVLVSFDGQGAVSVKYDADLTVLLGSPDQYYALASEPAEQQRVDGEKVAMRLADLLQLFVGPDRLQLSFRSFSAPKAEKSDYQDGLTSKLSTLTYVATLPTNPGSLRVVIPVGAPIDYPVAYTMQIPAAGVSVTRWLEAGIHESDPFPFADRMPSSTRPVPLGIDPGSLSWPRQLRLYLVLGFRHIVPEGIDHILFVLSLFFLGVTWRKLLSQTTVFTIAHATTLFLSTYGIVALPSRYVEPAIAFSIAFVAIENILNPRLGAARLAVVFAFGLIHGLGFASSLSEIPFPKKDFVVALIGFNFGVDFGQLFIIALAFLVVGWFRDRPWFRSRIAIPCSGAIAAIGLFWAVQRIVFYAAR